MKKILMVAYHYPPEGGSSGVLRALKFSKYLPASGWIPHILTLRESCYLVTDNGLLRDIPNEAVVHRTMGWDNARHFAIKGRHLACLSVPDRFVSWLLFAVPKGLSVIRKEGVRLIYSTSPPATAHLVAAALKIFTGIRWVADFRDPWVEEGISPLPGTIRYRVESFLERSVLRRCDLILVTTPNLKSEFLRRYPELPRDKVQVIYNGYDEDDFSNISTQGDKEYFEIIHAGLVTREFRNPLPLLEVISDLIIAGEISRETIKITFLGGDRWVASPQFAEAITRLGLDTVVNVEDRIPHEDALKRQADAAVLLLLQASDDTRALIPAKAFEYLRLGLPILAMTFEGATADLLKGRDNCFVVNPSDQIGLTIAVRSLYRQWSTISAKSPDSKSVHNYERSRLTRELATLIDQMGA